MVLQNRPNVKLVMLDTQVYSNTGGQNSDSSLMPGGYDMNRVGAATQGKLTEKKGVAESFTTGHGSPFVAQVSMANAAKLYKAMLDALEYRGTAFLQCYTACQPEHGVADDVSTVEAQRVRDARVMPEFTFHPGRGETRAEAFDLGGNPTIDRDWWETTFKSNSQRYRFTSAHFAMFEQRFRRHWKAVTPEEAGKLVPLIDLEPEHAARLRGSRSERDDLLAGEFRCVAHGRLDVLATQGRIAGQNLLHGAAGRQVVEDDRNHDARALDAYPSVTDVGVGSDPIAPIHGSMITRIGLIRQTRHSSGPTSPPWDQHPQTDPGDPP